MSLSFSNQKDCLASDPELTIRVNRPNCPFFGFSSGHGIFGMSLVDNEGNSCYFDPKHQPCRMQVAGNKPCWERCSSNTKRVRQALNPIKNLARVFPKELEPQQVEVIGDPWPGLSLADWMKYLNEMHQNP